MTRGEAGMGASAETENGAEESVRCAMVHNRDIPVLSGVLCAMKDLENAEDMCAWQRDRLFNITQHLSGMPHGGGGPKGLDDAFAVLSEVEAKYEEKCRVYASQIKSAQRIMNSIQSQSMKTFVMMRYIFGATDVEIRKELNMSKRGFYRAKNAVEEAESMSAVKWKEKYILV